MFAMAAVAQVGPPRILQIYREHWSPGQERENREIEDDAQRICIDLGCPHPYLRVESLSEPKEVWFFNGYDSIRKHSMFLRPIAKIRACAPWSLGRGRFLVISITKEPQDHEGIGIRDR
jgi:hypothetical protein